MTYGWSGTATASFTNGGFATPTKTFSAVTASKTAQNFVWSPSPVISGKVTKSGTSTGVPGMTITASNGGGATTTGITGSYNLTVPYNWTGVVTPSSASGGTFSPTTKSFSKVTANKTGRNFTWTAPVAGIVRQSVSGSATTALTDTAVPAEGFTQWALLHGLVGNPADLFGQDADGDGIPNGAEYVFGANLAKGEPLTRLLVVNGVLTVEVPIQDPATLVDAMVTVEFTRHEGSAIWFPAVCLPPRAPTPITKQWFQAGTGDASDFRVNVQLVK